MSLASSQTLTAPPSPVGPLGTVPTWSAAYDNPGPALGGGEATPPGSPRPDTGPAPRQETWSIAYGNPPPWLRESTAPLTRSNALRIATHQEFTADELDYGSPSIVAPRVGAYRPHFMEPLTNGSSAVSSPIDRGGGAAGGGVSDDELYRRRQPIRPTDEEVARMFPRGRPSILTDPITQEELDGSVTPPGMPSFPAPRIGPRTWSVTE